MIYIILRCIIRMFYNAWIPKNNRMVRNIAVNIGIWSYKYIIANYNITNNCCIYSNPNIISNTRCSFSFSTIFLTNRNSLVNINIVTNYCFRINCDPIFKSSRQRSISFPISVRVLNLFPADSKITHPFLNRFCASYIIKNTDNFSRTK